MEKKRTLLTVVSIILLIFGVFSVIMAAFGVLGGSMFAAAVDTTAGTATVIGVIICGAEGILELMAGVRGIKKKKLNECRNIGVTLLVLALLALALGGFGFTWQHIAAIALTVLYLVGLR